MIHTIIIGLIAISLAYLNKYKNFKYGLEFAFIILTIFLAIRFDWGNDYSNYLSSFINIKNNDYSAFDINFLKENDHEIGWIFLNKIFSPFGFFGLVIFLTIIENYILYRLIKKYVNKKWQWLSVFIYVFSPIFMLTCSSMMRQFLSICIYLISIRYIIEKKFLFFLLLNLLAFLFHKSAIILLPTYFITYLNNQIKHTNLLMIIYVVWYFFAAELVYIPLNSILSIESFEKYNYYIVSGSKAEIGTGLAVLFSYLLFFLILKKSKNLPANLSIISFLYLISLFITPLTTYGLIIGRLSIYFIFFIIVILPNIIPLIKNELLKYFVLIVYIAIQLKEFISFFYSDIWYLKFFYYKTIFSSQYWL